MPVPTDTALLGRARVLLEAMTERARWIYAVPRELDGALVASSVRAMLEARKLRCDEEDAAARVARFVDERGKVAVVTFDSPELDVLLVEASGPEAPPLLERTGFYAQSQLLRTALDVRDPEASKALRTLAHMVVAWDEDWSDLFLLHLASPDAIARHEATLALSVAAMVARDAGPAKLLLDEALRREKFPKLRETMSEALQVVEAMTGGPVALKPDAGGGEAEGG
jgi:hypothetical protein